MQSYSGCCYKGTVSDTNLVTAIWFRDTKVKRHTAQKERGYNNTKLVKKSLAKTGRDNSFRKQNC
jgi:hypothetical protein